MKRDESFGIVPVYVKDGQRNYLLVQHQAGHWGFPKGHAESGETPFDAAQRELREETGIAAFELLHEQPFSESYVYTKRSGRKVHKVVEFWVGEVASDEVTIQLKEVQAYAWGDADETRERITFDESRQLLDEVEGVLAGR